MATGAAAASATGIELAVAGAAVTLASCSLSGVSAYKTGKHLEVPEKIYDRRNAWPCKCLQSVENIAERKRVADVVLLTSSCKRPKSRLEKRMAQYQCLAASTGLYGLGRAVYKSIKDTRGKERTEMAAELTRHLLRVTAA